MLAILIEHLERQQIQEHEAEYLELTFESLSTKKLAPAAQFECLRGFNRLLQIIRSSTFSERWPNLYDFAWTRLVESQSYIERLCHADDAVDIEEIKPVFDNQAQAADSEAVF